MYVCCVLFNKYPVLNISQTVNKFGAVGVSRYAAEKTRVGFGSDSFRKYFIYLFVRLHTIVQRE